MRDAVTQLQPVCQPRGGTFETSPLPNFGEVSLARPRFDNGGKRAIADCGMAYAINNSNLGVLPDLAKRTGRGGPRNRADRESHALTAAQIANLMAAERHSAAIGLPFTRMITIHWEAAGVPLRGMAKATGRFTDLLGKMLRRHGSVASWLWVHEGGEDKGGHCHLLAHVPTELVPVLTAAQRCWLRRISGRPYRGRVIHSKPIGGRLGLEKGNPELHAVNLEVAIGYLCKAAPQETLDSFKIDRIHEPGGLVIGRRCSTSQNIGETARKTRQVR